MSSSRKPRQAGCTYTFFFPNASAKFNEDMRRERRKEDDIKLSKIYKLNFDIEKHDFHEACRSVMNDRTRAKTKNFDSFLPLHCCIYERGYKQLIELLIDAYPQALKEKDPKGMLPIHIAARDKVCIYTYAASFPVVSLCVCLSLCVCACLCTCSGLICFLSLFSPSSPLKSHLHLRLHLHLHLHLHLPLQTILVDIIQMLVRCYPPSIQVEDPTGDLPAHTSIRCHLPKEMTLAFLNFYEKAIDIPDTLGNTLLHMSIRYQGEQELIEELLKRRPDTIHAKNNAGDLPFHRACMFHSSPEVRYVAPLLPLPSSPSVSGPAIIK